MNDAIQWIPVFNGYFIFVNLYTAGTFFFGIWFNLLIWLLTFLQPWSHQVSFGTQPTCARWSIGLGHQSCEILKRKLLGVTVNPTVNPTTRDSKVSLGDLMFV